MVQEEPLSEAIEGAQVAAKNTPSWAKSLIKWLGVSTAIIVALAALLSGLGKLGDALQAPCNAMGWIPWCASPAPKPLPKLDPYQTGWVEGGHTQAEYCAPRRDAYQKQYPDLKITWTASEENKKDWLGHVQYRYSCLFTAAPAK